MAEADMRLRLVVRRHRLPEARLMWNMRLDNNPTISKLLEQLDKDVPLESEEWGLEDYVVELHDEDGTDFECLHFQNVRNVLKPDDRVFIRPLDRDDHRRRRVSGRDQISTDGRHLIDGVPFGRSRLRSPVGRPPVRIPALKRPRLTYDQRDMTDPASDSSPLMLTNGEGLADEDDSEVEDSDYDFGSGSVTDHDSGDSEDDLPPEDNEDEEEDDDDIVLSEDDDLDREALDLADENTALGHADDDMVLDQYDGNNAGDSPPQQHSVLDLETLDKISVLHAAFPDAGIDVCEGILNFSKGNLRDAYHLLLPGRTRRLTWDELRYVDAADEGPASDLIAAFPTAGKELCEAILTAAKDDMRCAFLVLEGFDPKVSLEEIQLRSLSEDENREDILPEARAPTSTGSKQPSMGATAKTNNEANGDIMEEEIEEDEEEEPEDNALLRRYDSAGFPPGTITSGKGLAHTAIASASFGSSKFSGASEATTTTLKASPEKQVDQDSDDETSSSGSSSSEINDDGEDSEESEASEKSQDDDDADTDSSSEPSESSGSENSESDSDGSDGADLATDVAPDSDSHESTDDSSDSETSDGGEEDSGPEERPVGRSTSDMVDSDSDATSESDEESSSDSSDVTSESLNTDSDSDSSNDSSSDSDSDPTSDSDDDVEAKSNVGNVLPVNTATSGAPADIHEPQAQPLPGDLRSKPVPPGAGMKKTQLRNARRKAHAAKQRAERESGITSGSGSGNDVTSTNEAAANQEPAMDVAALFEAKRNALLAQIESGGVEIDASGNIDLGPTTTESRSEKRKRPDEETSGRKDEGATPGKETPQCSNSEEPSSATSSQKRRRVDMGAGRRLLFGALGLRNPKTKEDEDQLRAKLMKDVRPLITPREKGLEETVTEHSVTGGVDPQYSDNWQLKINYRAVECCQDGVELTAAPFPFQQRWDPQQQGSFSRKKNKRGGRSKKAQRNQSHFYDDDREGRRKRKRAELIEWGGDNDEGRYNDVTGNDVELNYDDVDPVPGQSETVANEMSEATDLDDLPPLPEDASSLAALRPGQAQVGMVITWQKWFCSSGTRWQPQLSRVSGIVVRIDEEDSILEVCMAKRDRHLDGTEKQYDQITGKRVYGKFEAPDLDEDEDHNEGGEDEGYRTVSWDEMQDPRILQQPLEPTVDLNVDTSLDPSGVIIQSIEGVAKPDDREITESNKTPTSAQPQTKTVDNDPTNSFHSARFSPIEGVPESEAAIAHTSESLVKSLPEMLQHQQQQQPQQSGTGETNLTGASSHQAGQGQQTADIPMSDVSRTTSPSRQLHETSQNMEPTTLADATGDRDELSLPTITSSQQLPTGDASVSRLDNDTQADIIAGTPRVVRLHQIDAPSSDSIYSGRQPDYAMDVDSHVTDSFVVTDVDHTNTSEPEPDFDHVSPSAQRSPSTPVPSHRISTPDQHVDADVDGETRVEDEDDVTKTPQAPDSTKSTSSVDSLTAIFHTAVTSRATQSPSKTQSSSTRKRPSKSRVLPESSDDEWYGNNGGTPSPKVANSNLIKIKREQMDDESGPPSTAPPSFMRNSSEESGPRATKKISPPPSRRRRAQPKPFVLPPGSQVFELSSDSEPAPAENYADDDVDETYAPAADSSLPKGDGWVKKKKPRKAASPVFSRKPRATASFSSQSLSRASGSGLFSSSQPARLVSPPKGRRKTSARF